MIYLFLYEMEILEEMKRMEVKPNVRTYICLLNACAADGRIDIVYVAIYFLHYLILYYELLLPLIPALYNSIVCFLQCFFALIQCPRIVALF